MSTAPTFTNLQIYNNYFHGIWSKFGGGGQTTAAIFVDDYPAGGQTVAPKIFNNFISFDATDTGVANGYILAGNGGPILVNNTIIAVAGGGGQCLATGNNAGNRIENNVCWQPGGAAELGGTGSPLGTWDYNNYYQNANNFYQAGSEHWVSYPACPSPLRSHSLGRLNHYGEV